MNIAIWSHHPLQQGPQLNAPPPPQTRPKMVQPGWLLLQSGLRSAMETELNRICVSPTSTICRVRDVVFARYKPRSHRDKRDIFWLDLRSGYHRGLEMQHLLFCMGRVESLFCPALYEAIMGLKNRLSGPRCVPAVVRLDEEPCPTVAYVWEAETTADLESPLVKAAIANERIKTDDIACAFSRELDRWLRQYLAVYLHNFAFGWLDGRVNSVAKEAWPKKRRP